jgi:hypothetical protein
LKVLRTTEEDGVFGPNREEIKAYWRRMHKEELNN